MRERLIELIRDSHFVDTWNHYTDDFKEPNPIDELADYLLANGVIVPPLKINDLIFGVFAERNVGGDKAYDYLEGCRVNEIMYFPSGKFVFGVREVNGKRGHNMNFEDMYFSYEEAEAALKGGAE